MAASLRAPLGAYFAAHNAQDADRVAACFSEDAVVRDEGHDNRGRAAVRAWASETSRRYHHTAEVLAVEDAPDRTVVTARVTGNFPGSPAELRYRFQLDGDAIRALEIG
jgi:ketosteroid isomerase-like protein